MHRLLLAVLTFVLSCPAAAQQAVPNAPAEVHHPRSTRNHFPMTTWRFMGEMNTAGNRRGFAQVGAEFWCVIVDRRGQRTGRLSARFPQSSWRNLDIHASILAPGRTG
jgi:hypothetical protein